MRFALGNLRPAFCMLPVAYIALAMTVISGDKASAADNVFIDQAHKGGSYQGQSYTPTAPATQAPATAYVPRSGSTAVTPETASMTGGNVATTFELGQYNHVFQAQAGSRNVSNVGILAGVNNNVGVLQAGHSLTSNLLLVNTQGLSIGVIQPNGSAPVNMMIARLPNGGLMIKR